MEANEMYHGRSNRPDKTNQSATEHIQQTIKTYERWKKIEIEIEGEKERERELKTIR